MSTERRGFTAPAPPEPPLPPGSELDVAHAEIAELRKLLAATVTKLGVAKFQLQQERHERDMVQRQLAAERAHNAARPEPDHDAEDRLGNKATGS